MIVMVSNISGTEVGLLAGKHLGRVGHLYSPGGQRGPWEEIPYALDNGAWPAFKNGTPWSESAWMTLLRWASAAKFRPLWALVPDVVGDRNGTIQMWDKYSRTVDGFGFRRAFAVQDGMTFDDVPDRDCTLFLGGSTEWKINAIPSWCSAFPGRVHVGRVNTLGRLRLCHDSGAASVDGTGWFHKGRSPAARSQLGDLKNYLKET